VFRRTSLFLGFWRCRVVTVWWGGASTTVRTDVREAKDAALASVFVAAVVAEEVTEAMVATHDRINGKSEKSLVVAAVDVGAEVCSATKVVFDSEVDGRLSVIAHEQAPPVSVYYFSCNTRIDKTRTPIHCRARRSSNESSHSHFRFFQFGINYAN